MKRFAALVFVIVAMICSVGFAQTSIEELQFRAGNGEAEAQNSLGLRYLLGDGIKQDYDTAFVWFLLSANRNYAKAQYNLAVMYASGLGVRKNNDQAVHWHCKASNQGLTPAKYNLSDEGNFFSSETSGASKDKQEDQSSDSERAKSKGTPRVEPKRVRADCDKER